MRRWVQIVAQAATSWRNDKAFKHCAAVSFYTLFSLAPVMIIALAIVGFFFGEAAARSQLSFQIAQLVGKSGADLIQQAVAASEPQKTGWFSTGIGVALLLVGATTVFGQLQDSLNEIWSVVSQPSRNGFVVLILQRLVSFALILTVGFLLLVSLVLTTALTALVKYVGGAEFTSALRAADFLGSIAMTSALFALVFKVMPDVQLRWRDVWRGAVATAVLFALGRYLIALYLAHSTVASAYGAAGSLAALLVWVYYSAAILFFGVEFVRSDCAYRGREVKPRKTAVAVRRELVAEVSDSAAAPQRMHGSHTSG